MTRPGPPRLLFVTNMYPSEDNPHFGIFVDEQIRGLVAALDCEWDVHFINARERGPLEYLRSIFSIPRRIRRHRHDIVHVHYGLAGLFLLFFRPRARTFVTLHGADILPRQGRTWQVRLTRAIIKRADRVFILNDEMESEVRSRTSKYTRLPCGVDTDLFRPGPGPQPGRRHRVVVFPGNPQDPIKDFGLFNEVIDRVRRRASFPVEIRCVHQLTRTGVRDLLDSGDCLLMTSVSEGSPQVVKEALACGLPVVSVPVGDVAAMTDGIPGCRVSDAHDAEELADLVARTLSESVDRAGVRDAFLAKRTYDAHSVTARLLDHYGLEASQEPGAGAR